MCMWLYIVQPVHVFTVWKSKLYMCLVCLSAWTCVYSLLICLNMYLQSDDLPEHVLSLHEHVFTVWLYAWACVYSLKICLHMSVHVFSPLCTYEPFCLRLAEIGVLDITVCYSTLLTDYHTSFHEYVILLFYISYWASLWKGDMATYKCHSDITVRDRSEIITV